MRAWEILRNVGIPRRTISVYVMIGFQDTPDDALYRLRTVTKKLGSYAVPMRYQPINSRVRNEYVAPGWTDWELVAYKRYWGFNRNTGIPFGEWLEGYRLRQSTEAMEQLAFT